MKLFHKPTLLLLLVSIFFISCQKEEIDIIDETPSDAITAASDLAKLLINTSQNSGGIDDFIDGTSCSSIQFPYEVIINGQTITIADEDDLNNLVNTTATITVVFPVTVVFEDFSTLEINSQQELNELAALCQTIDEAINCVEFVYPVTFFTYNSNNEQTGTVVINSNAELFQFITGLDAGVYIAIDFPIEVILGDGSQVTVTSNAQLQGIIENCDEPGDDPPTPLDLETVLTTDSWFVSYFFDDEDETFVFAGYEFFFNPGGEATATNGSTSIPGSWSITNSSSGQLKLNLDFGVNDPFDELEEDWKVMEFSNELIRLFDISGGDGSTDYLTFSRTPTDGGGSSEAQELRDAMTDGNWFISLYLEDGDEDETSHFNSFTFDFMENGQIAVSNSSVTLEGTWFVSGSDSNLKLVLNFIDVYPLDELDEDWSVVSFSNTLIDLIEENDDDGDILKFEKL
ncbi:hypothetical protein [Planktosalinus lacus]|uniref:Uncharacterized protein n=1 Tax=Planktosalinus lacus TaxID=1526573 RepID=A0A8J2Y7W0_9FLAO|nr:hypothetical protein [Planktosalinus lacus]GGD98796.1 hypothetical protein GCM10011312_22890 [Planktosalinus lacus]